MASKFNPFAAQMYIGGEYVEYPDAAVLSSLNPATQEPVGKIADGTVAEVARAVEVAAIAQRDWQRLEAKNRAALLHRVADSIEQTSPRAVARQMTLEMGKPYPEAVGELHNVAPVFRYFAEMARDQAGHLAGAIQANSLPYARDEPLGVSGHIVPFNYPILLMSWTVAASLAAGNGCVIKPAPTTTLCTLLFMQHFTALPPGLVNCITGGAAAGRALAASPAVGAIAFTGGAAAAQEVGAICGGQMKPCLLESGGNDALIITSQAPLEVAVAGAVTAAFHLSGQICTSAERFFVDDAVHDEFVEKFAAATKRLRLGDGLSRAEIGPLVSRAGRDKVVRIVEDAKARGATVVCGGRIPAGMEQGWFYEPTILTEVSAEMAVMREEVFGPVAAVRRCRDFAEALQCANDTAFGLGASVFTTDLAEAMEAADVLQAGMVWVNNPLVDNDALPFGGWKMSGLGRCLGKEGLDFFRRRKMVIIDHQPQIQDWWYPYPDNVFYDGATDD